MIEGHCVLCGTLLPTGTPEGEAWCETCISEFYFKEREDERGPITRGYSP